MRLRLSLLIALALLVPTLRAQTPYQYFRTGNPADVTVQSEPGYALMGGGEDLDEAFSWLCDKAHGGDLLVLRSHGTDAYNPYIAKLCHLNSVATIIIGSRDAANNPEVASKIRHAAALFISGGDQSEYVNFWTGTPVQAELNAAIARGIPIGGTSAGLAVLGQFAYTAQGDAPDDKDLDSETVLQNPFHPRVTLSTDFLQISLLKNTITDSHLARRKRMGRLIVFLARLNAQHNQTIRGIGIDERAAVLLSPDGQARVVGHTPVYLLTPDHPAEALTKGQPLAYKNIPVLKLTPGQSFDFKTWAPSNPKEGMRYTLSVIDGKLTSTQKGGKVF